MSKSTFKLRRSCNEKRIRSLNRISLDSSTKSMNHFHIFNQSNILNNQRLWSASVANKLQTSQGICQVPQNQLQYTGSSDRFFAIVIESSGPMITVSIGWYLLCGYCQAPRQTPHCSQALYTKHKLAGSTQVKTRWWLPVWRVAISFPARPKMRYCWLKSAHLNWYWIVRFRRALEPVMQVVLQRHCRQASESAAEKCGIQVREKGVISRKLGETSRKLFLPYGECCLQPGHPAEGKHFQAEKERGSDHCHCPAQYPCSTETGVLQCRDAHGLCWMVLSIHSQPEH